MVKNHEEKSESITTLLKRIVGVAAGLTSFNLAKTAVN